MIMIKIQEQAFHRDLSPAEANGLDSLMNKPIAVRVIMILRVITYGLLLIQDKRSTAISQR